MEKGNMNRSIKPALRLLGVFLIISSLLLAVCDECRAQGERNFFGKLADGAKTAFRVSKNVVTQAARNTVSTARDIGGAIKDTVMNIGDNLKDSAQMVGDLAKVTARTIAKVTTDPIGTAKDVARQTIDNWREVAGGVGEVMEDFRKDPSRPIRQMAEDAVEIGQQLAEEPPEPALARDRPAPRMPSRPRVRRARSTRRRARPQPADVNQAPEEVEELDRPPAQDQPIDEIVDRPEEAVAQPPIEREKEAPKRDKEYFEAKEKDAWEKYQAATGEADKEYEAAGRIDAAHQRWIWRMRRANFEYESAMYMIDSEKIDWTYDNAKEETGKKRESTLSQSSVDYRRDIKKLKKTYEANPDGLPIEELNANTQELINSVEKTYARDSVNAIAEYKHEIDKAEFDKEYEAANLEAMSEYLHALNELDQEYSAKGWSEQKQKDLEQKQNALYNEYAKKTKEAGKKRDDLLAEALSDRREFLNKIEEAYKNSEDFNSLLDELAKTLDPEKDKELIADIQAWLSNVIMFKTKLPDKAAPVTPASRKSSPYKQWPRRRKTYRVPTPRSSGESCPVR